jgi:zinc protease
MIPRPHRRFFCAIIMMAALLWIAAQPVHAGNFNFESAALHNGLRVVVIPNHRMPIVTHMVWYNVGAMDEIGGKSGLAHFLEHLMFKGTPDVPSGDFSKTVARLGGNENAFTSSDYTVYFQQVSKSHLTDVMRLESDRMQNLILSPEDFASEKKVILEERRMRIDNNPSSILSEEMVAALFRNHPYGRPLIGWEHEIQSLTQNDVLDFYRRYYAPNNAIVVISGDVTWDEIKSDIEDIYGKADAREIVRPVAPSEPEQRSNRTVYYQSPKVKQPQFSRYVPVPSQYTAADRKLVRSLELLADILGGGSDSRMYNAMVIGDKSAIAAASYYVSDIRGPSMFGIAVTPSPKYSAEKITAAVKRVLRDIVSNGIAEDELRRFKNSMVAESIYARDSNFRMAYLVGETLSQGGTLDDINQWDNDIESITASDIQLAAKMILDSVHVDGWLLPGAGINPSASDKVGTIQLPAGAMR